MGLLPIEWVISLDFSIAVIWFARMGGFARAKGVCAAAGGADSFIGSGRRILLWAEMLA